MIRRSLFSHSLRMSMACMMAVALWVFVSFTENPQQTLPLTNLPIIAEGLNADLILVDPATGQPVVAPDAVVNADMVGPKDLLAALNKQNVQPYVSLGGLGPGLHQVPVQMRVVPARPEIRFNTLSPEQIRVEIEQIITASVPLSVTVVGQPPTSYEASVPLVTMNNEAVETVAIVGPANLVRRVVAGQIEIDLSSQTTNLRTQRDVLPIDMLGRVVEGVVVQPEEVLVAVNILSSSGIKRVPIIYVIEGQPPTGLRPEITLDPAFVSIIGSSRALANVDFIETEPLVLAGNGQAFTSTLRLRFPSGVTARDARAAETTVATVELVPIDTPFVVKLPVLAVNEDPDTDVQITPRLIEVKLRGSPLALQGEPTLVVSVDVAGLAPGSYTLVPSIVLPGGLALAEPLQPLDVLIIERVLPTPTPAPQPTADPRTPVGLPTPTTEGATPTPSVEQTPETSPTVVAPTLSPTPVPEPSPTP